MLLERGTERAMWLSTGLSKWMPILSRQAKVASVIKNKEDQGFYRDTSGWITLFRGWEFQLGQWSKLLTLHHIESIRRKKLTSMARRGSKDEGQSADLQGWEDKRCGDLPFLVVGCNHLPPLRIGWSTSIAIYYSVIARVPRRLGQEFRNEFYPFWYLTDCGWALWYREGIWCLEQGALLP